MELKYLENKINSIDYQDRQLLGLETRYFGFELEIRLEDTAETCYVLELRGCRKTQITFGEDQFWETNYHKNLHQQQLGFFIQEINFSFTDNPKYKHIQLHFSFLDVEADFTEIEIKKITL